MNCFFIILIVLIAIVLMLLYIPIRVAVVFSEKNIQLKVANIVVLGRKKKGNKENKSKENDDIQDQTENTTKQPNTLKNLAKKISQLKEAYEQEKDDIEVFFQHLKEMVTLIHYRIVASFGLDNPADTGMATGAIYAFFSSIESYLRNYITPKKNSYFTATPDFTKSKFEVNGEAVFTITLIKLIRMLKLGKNIYKRNKRKVKIILRGGSIYERSST